MSDLKSDLSQLVYVAKKSYNENDVDKQLLENIDNSVMNKDEYLKALLDVIPRAPTRNNNGGLTNNGKMQTIEDEHTYEFIKNRIHTLRNNSNRSGGKSRRKHRKSRKSHHRLKRQRLRTRRRHTHRLRQRNR